MSDIIKMRREVARQRRGSCCQIPGCDTSDGLVWHHVDPKTKLFTLGMGWSLAWTRVEDELDKCVLICKKHHKEVHMEMRWNDPTPEDLWITCRDIVSRYITE